jgi:hypothetical protein
MASPFSGYAGSAGSNLAGVGTVAWNNTANAVGAPDGAVAITPETIGSATVTESLDLYNFAPAIPAGNQITGIQIVMTALKAGLRLLDIDSCQLTLGGVTGTPTTTNASGTGLTTTSATYTFGGSSDPWGFTQAQLANLANVNSAVEGTGPTFSVWFVGGGGSSAAEAEVDAVQITLWYAPANTGGGQSTVSPVAALWLGSMS